VLAGMLLTSFFQYRKKIGEYVYQTKGNYLERVSRKIVMKPKEHKKFSISKIFTVDYQPEQKGIVTSIT